MHRLIMLALILSAVGIVVGESIRGAPGIGVLFGAGVLASTGEWWRQRTAGESIRTVADRLAVCIMGLAIALACAGPLQALEAWLASR
jgi:hypothetical protein